MIILKSQVFDRAQKLALFVNGNQIKKEDILSITNVGAAHYTIFFYADEAIQEKVY